GELIRKGFQFKKLATSHAFHSSMMDSILDTYGKKLKEINFHDIKIPFISNLTGEWITEEQAKSADYWVNHLRHVVKFSEGVQHLLSGTENVFVEVGPGRTLSSFVRQHTQGKSICPIVNTVRHPKEKTCDDKYLL
ncbi:acyltransferase domain-containing protein, partial [Bacillus wiedmannii]